MTRHQLEGLVLGHQTEIYRYLRYLGADRSLAEDLVQETFLAALGSAIAPASEEPRAQTAWLRGIARNQFYAYCRRRKPAPLTPAALEQAEKFWASEFLRQEDGFEYLEALRSCLARLGERQRRFLELRYAQDRSRSDMARLLQMTEDGVKSALQRLRALLADCVESRLRTAAEGL